MATRIYTKTGDSGETGLAGGIRVPKDHVRVEAYGTVDELNSSLGLARAWTPTADIDALLARIQSLLFELGAQLATPGNAQPGGAAIIDQDINDLEHAIDEHEQALPKLRQFILPAGTPLAAALHMGRSICRRAERRVVTLSHSDSQLPINTIIFLNRLSDLLFVLARRANQLATVNDVCWQPRA